MSKGIARLLASRFEHIKVFRFPDPEYDNFRQAVKGKVTKIISKVEEYKGDVLEHRQLDRYVVSIKILNRNGKVRELT
jgi:hypothetical protein